MSEQASRIRENSFFSLLSQLIRLFTNFFLFVGIARFYGPVAFGQFTTAHTLSTIFLLVADFGLDVILTTEVARQRYKASELFKRYFSIKLVFVLLATIGMWVVLIVQPMSSSARWLTGIFSIYVTFTALMNFYFALFKGFEQFKYETTVSFINNLILLGGLVILGIIGVPLLVVVCAFVGTRAIGLASSIRIASRILPNQSFRFSLSGWKEVRSQVFTFGFHLLFGNLFFILDTILLAFWKGDHEAGIYQSAFRLITIFLVIPDVIINALMPVLSRFYGQNRERWNELGKLMNKTLVFFGLPIALILLVYAEQIIYLVYGTKAYADAIPILRLFGVIVLIRFSVETYALMLTTSQCQKYRLIVVVLATIINYVLNLYAIPKYGPFGAVVVSLATNLFVGAGYIIATRPTRLLFFRWLTDLRNIIPLSVTVILGFVLWGFRTFPFLYLSPFLLAAYLLLFYFIGYTKDERKFVFAVKSY